jgi:hypothetical protein
MLTGYGQRLKALQGFTDTRKELKMKGELEYLLSASDKLG